MRLANGDKTLRYGMDQLFDLFRKAPDLGSLIDPRAVTGEDELLVKFHDLQPLLRQALEREDAKKSPDLHEIGVTARGLAHAAEILAGKFSLVATNYPFLGLEKQGAELGDFLKKYFEVSKRELATSFLVRSEEWCGKTGVCAAVTPSEWTYARPHRHFRSWLLDIASIQMMCPLGRDAFVTGLRCNPQLVIASWHHSSGLCSVIDVREKDLDQKPFCLANGSISQVDQKSWKSVPDSRFIVDLNFSHDGERLSTVAEGRLGVGAGDGPRFERVFWEIPVLTSDWEFLQGPIPKNIEYSGRHAIIFWQQEKGEMFELAQSVRHLNHAAQNWQRGRPFWGRRGVLLSQMGGFTIYTGEIYDGSCLVLMPKNKRDLLPLVAYALSGDLKDKIAKYEDTFRIASPQTVLDAPFDSSYWQRVAAEKYPHGLPKPHSDDPTQWLFNGHPKGATTSLYVAVARLLGYCWPRQTGSAFPDCPALDPDGLEKFADDDGIVCVNAIKGESPAGERLQDLLVAAFGRDWSADKLSELLAQSGARSLEDWLRNYFFEEHCAIFHQRPFLWQIWDGRKDGFSAIVNYHRLDRATLEKLTYAYLGDWLRRQQAAKEAGEAGSDARHQAAVELQEKLKLILEGEPPYDIFVRWKPIEQQPLGWEPDLNDGVRLNIRPFVTADILRKRPNINWRKDRGKDVTSAPWFDLFGGERINDHHLTLEEKRAARLQADTSSADAAALTP